ncbi:MoaB/Mog domain-containing protein [Dioscorea alata]|uniref:MoaB/Mog domain-containing protein n=1 Tax=Dioscorea alata TaxID=55571 RepID=A0ACB7V660_DIOAL|nr:MoaB/Mog domain-containing protein [Dioscorea alata]
MGSVPEEGGGGGGGATVVVMGRAEIDTSAPFRSVKEAVMLFGEKVLAGEIYGHRLHQMQAATEKRHELGLSRLSSIADELEETRQNLEKAREESLEMANCLSSLRKELQKAKKELTQLKEAKHSSPKKQVMESEIEEDLKFVENKTEMMPKRNDVFEFQKRRCVTFANPPSLAQVINPQNHIMLERQLSVDRDSVTLKKKKKPLIPLIGGMFSKKKNNNHHHHQDVMATKAHGVQAMF